MNMEGNAAATGNLGPMIESEALETSQVAHDGAVPHTEPAALGLNGTGWVSLAMLVLILILLIKKVPAAIGAGLDKRIATIREQLDQAARLRAEAEALRAEYEGKARTAAQEADAMIAHARVEAEAILAKAEQDAVTLTERRARMAEDKIGAAERTALAEVRTRAASVAAAAAATLIRERNDAAADRALVDRTIAAIGTGTRPN